MGKKYTSEQLVNLANPETLLQDVDTLNENHESLNNLTELEQYELITNMLSSYPEDQALPRLTTFASDTSPFFLKLTVAVQVTDRIRSIPKREIAYQALTEDTDIINEFGELTERLLSKHQDEYIAKIIASQPDKAAKQKLRPFFSSCHQPTNSSENVATSPSFFASLNTKLVEADMQNRQSLSANCSLDNKERDEIHGITLEHS